MKTTRILKAGLAGFVFTALMTSGVAQAIPTFQVYADGGVAGSYNGDQDTWYVGSGPFTFQVVGAYGPNTASLTGVTLVISVLQGQTGTITLTAIDGDEAPVLLTAAGLNNGLPSATNPLTNADSDLLTNVAGIDGYATTAFLPDKFNNHYPLKDDVSDFLVYNLSSFTNTEFNLPDFNADGAGSITTSNASGEIKKYQISYTGFSGLHIDAYGYETEQNGTKNLRYSWDINPGSHDSTSKVPEPGTLLLLGSGLLGLGLMRRKKNIA